MPVLIWTKGSATLTARKSAQESAKLSRSVQKGGQLWQLDIKTSLKCCQVRSISFTPTTPRLLVEEAQFWSSCPAKHAPAHQVPRSFSKLKTPSKHTLPCSPNPKERNELKCRSTILTILHSKEHTIGSRLVSKAFSPCQKFKQRFDVNETTKIFEIRTARRVKSWCQSTDLGTWFVYLYHSISMKSINIYSL